jgi:putative DNA primase/helicase
VVPFLPNRQSVGETIAALKAVAHLNPTLEMPCWLDGRPSPPPGELISFPNGLLDLRTRMLGPPDPAFFTLAALGFDYLPEAPQPSEWIKFLSEIFGGEQAQIEALQEAFGYLITGDTSQEKAFLLLGPPRSGKGTILGMLRRLLPTASVAGPSLLSLATNFGLAPLIGKQLAIIDDLRVGSPKDQDVLIENVLKITGRGWFTLDRKYKGAWSGPLPIKLVLVSNVMPQLGDDSAAIASRFLILITRVSFLGREDPRLLEDKLRPERDGILHWALDGLLRLRKRGHFVEPEASLEARLRLANLGSPTLAFVAEQCEYGADYHVSKSDIYDAWYAWAESNETFPGTREKFLEALYAAANGRVRAGRPGGAGKQVPSCMGIRLKSVPSALGDEGRGGEQGDLPLRP